MRAAGFRHIAGVDEVGRGCLAGPVVAAAVIPDPGVLIPGVADSKQLTAEARAALAAEIRAGAKASAVIAVDAAVIDRINILEATKRAMLQAVAGLETRPDVVLVDAVTLNLAPTPTLPVIRGDHVSYAIAAASILAKTERDRLMTDLDSTFPGYGFAEHKGYAAPSHRRALASYGPCPIHRLTFRSVVPRVMDGHAGPAREGSDGPV